MSESSTPQNQEQNQPHGEPQNTPQNPREPIDISVRPDTEASAAASPPAPASPGALPSRSASPSGIYGISPSGVYGLSPSDIYELGDADDLAVDDRDMAGPREILPPDEPRQSRFTWLSWIVAVAFVALMSLWAARAGLRVRDDLWSHTRSIRYLSDIENAWYYGHDILRRAENTAGLPAYADAMAGKTAAEAQQPGMPNPVAAGSRRLTLHEVLESVVSYYDYRMRSSPDGRYWMDYGPLRLTIMTLWVRHTQRINPRIQDFPRDDQNDPRVDTALGQPEDIARPLLQFNMICTAVAAVALFFLTWLWTVRGSRGEPPEPVWLSASSSFSAKTARLLAQIFPPRLLAFMLATAGFWYALIVLTGIPPRPAPFVRLVQVKQEGRALLIQTVANPQGAGTNLQIDYGNAPFYGQLTWQNIGNGNDDVPQTLTIPAPPDGQTLHLRVTAASFNGTTHTPDFAVTAPLSEPLNPTGIEAGGAQWPDWTVWARLGALFLAMLCFARRLPMPHRGWACGFVAALLVWFDPSVMMNAVVWPQWDVWILPLFCLAALAASLDWWIAAGVFIGIGCLLKGQMLLGGPVLLLWPLFSGRFGAVIKLISGAALAVGVIVWPFIVPTDVAGHWLISVEIASVVVLFASLLRDDAAAIFHRWREHRSFLTPRSPHERRRHWIAAIVTLLATACVVMVLPHGLPNPLPPFAQPALIALGLVIALGPWFLQRKALVGWMTTVFAAAVWIAAWLFNGDFNWWLLSIEYGSTKQDKIQMGARFFSNLPGILAVHYGWNLHDLVGTISLHLAHWQFSQEMELKFAMSLLYAIFLILCGLATALAARRGDPKFLIAITLPWLIFPTIMCQMGERYLIWPAALSATFVTISSGMTLIHVLIAWLGAGMIACQLLSHDPSRWPGLLTLFERMYPDGGWILLLLCAVLLVQCFVPTRRPVAIDLS